MQHTTKKTDVTEKVMRGVGEWSATQLHNLHSVVCFQDKSAGWVNRVEGNVRNRFNRTIYQTYALLPFG